jgi:hypothetical protein
MARFPSKTSSKIVRIDALAPGNGSRHRETFLVVGELLVGIWSDQDGKVVI